MERRKMHGMEELRKAGRGSIVPLYEEIALGTASDELEVFMKLSDYGRTKDCILLESADVVTKYGEKSLGASQPCIKAVGRGRKFEIIALNGIGRAFLRALHGKLGFCGKLAFSEGRISGSIPEVKGFVSEAERLGATTAMDVLRAVAFMLKPAYEPFPVHAGLMGVIAYDFIDQFEKLPASRKDVLKEPDFEMNFYDSLFIFGHKDRKLALVANAMLFDGTDSEKASELERCEAAIAGMRAAIGEGVPAARKPGGARQIVSTDMGRGEFVKMVSALRKRVLAGDVFQVVPSRTIVARYTSEPLDIYAHLRRLNPSPYMFYFSGSSGILLGSSPETFIKVDADGAGKRLEIRPIAGTKPRGILPDGSIDPDLDSRYEAELKTDRKELAEHTMLIDLARNDVARVSEPGSRVCARPYMVEKYSHVQHLVSSVTGTLRPGLDALHAYLASMNMGTLTGAPKVEAMKLLRAHEKTRRGFYGGSIGYLTPSGRFDSAIVIRSMTLKDGKAYIRAGAGIVYDSVPEQEFLETGRKAMACLSAIEAAEKGNGESGRRMAGAEMGDGASAALNARGNGNGNATEAVK